MLEKMLLRRNHGCLKLGACEGYTSSLRRSLASSEIFLYCVSFFPHPRHHLGLNLHHLLLKLFQQLSKQPPCFQLCSLTTRLHTSEGALSKPKSLPWISVFRDVHCPQVVHRRLSSVGSSLSVRAKNKNEGPRATCINVMNQFNTLVNSVLCSPALEIQVQI